MGLFHSMLAVFQRELIWAFVGGVCASYMYRLRP
jgi:hypothetical protein